KPSTFLVVVTLCLYQISSAQVDVDKSINLSGSGSNAKISGIKNVSAAQDAVSAEIVQNGSLVYAAASGTDNYSVTLSPAPTAYAAGMKVNFLVGASNANTGSAT